MSQSEKRQIQALERQLATGHYEREFRSALADAEVFLTLEQDFLRWALDKQKLSLQEIQFSHLLQWAEALPVTFSPQVFEVLSLVLDRVQEKVRIDELEEIFNTGDAHVFRWTNLLQDQVEAEIEARKLEYAQAASEKQTSLHDMGTREREFEDRIGSAMLFRSCTPDSAGAKDLQWMVTTNNVPSGELQAVLQYLAELERMQPQGLGLITGSGSR